MDRFQASSVLGLVARLDKDQICHEAHLHIAAKPDFPTMSRAIDSSPALDDRPLADLMSDPTKRSSLIGALSLSIAFAAYDAWQFSEGRVTSDELQTLYQVIVSAFLAKWIIVDARQLHRAPPTFDYGWFIIFAFPAYVPYYLISTRRWRGLVLFAGMLLLFWLPWFAEVLVWLFQLLVWFAEVVVWYIRAVLTFAARATVVVLHVLPTHPPR
jgi:hypothetical protein